MTHTIWILILTLTLLLAAGEERRPHRFPGDRRAPAPGSLNAF